MARKASKVPVEKGKAESTEVARPGAHHPLQALREEMNRAFERFFDIEPFRGFEVPMSLPRFTWAPRTDVDETDNEYSVTVELPGVDAKDVSVSIDSGVLTIKGEKKQEREEKEKDYHLTERSYGSFQRSFRLPDSVDDTKISASHEKGVLSVTLPKTKKSKPAGRTVSIKTK